MITSPRLRAPPARWPLPLLLVLLLAAACQDGTGAFAPGGKAATLIKPVDRTPAGAAPQAGEDDDGAEEEAPALPPGHPKVGGAASSDDLLARVETMKAELQGRKKSLEVLVALGDLYFEKQRYLDAIDWYREAITVAEPALARFDALPRPARAARVPDAVKDGCRHDAQHGFEALSALAEGHARKGETAAADYCWGQALEPAFLARARRGYAFVLVGNPAQGLSDEEWVLRRKPDFAEALFYQGASLAELGGNDVAMLRRARDSWKRLLEVDPRGPNAEAIRAGIAQVEERIANGGKPRAGPAMAAGAAPGKEVPDPGSINAGAEESIANLDVSDPEFWKAAEGQVAQGEAQLAAGEWTKARENIKGILPVLMMKASDSPLLPRVLTAMGIAYVQLGNKELGPRMLEMALQKDPKNAQARAALDAFQQGRPLPKFQPPPPQPAKP